MKLKKVILNFSKEELELIKSNSECLISDLSKSTESVESKANILFILLILVIGSCLGVLINKYPSIDYSDLITHEVIIVLLAAFFSLKKIYKVLNLNDYKLLGTEPSFHINFDGYNSENKIKEILKDTIVSYQSVIDKNTEIHISKVKDMQHSLDCIMKGIFFSIAYAFLHLVINFLFLQQ